MITEYFVCSGSDTAKLHDAVNQAIKNGWQPFGGVAVIMMREPNDPYAVASLFCQAVVKMAAK
jgi:hypothetical protein